MDCSSAAAITWLWWPDVVSTAFNKCIHERKNYSSYRELREEHVLPALIDVRIKLHIACGLHVINGYRDALVAFSGIAVAAFTATLWWATVAMKRVAAQQHREMIVATAVTRKAANAAQQSADALPALERAHVFLQIKSDDIASTLRLIDTFDDQGPKQPSGIRVGPIKEVLSETFDSLNRQFGIQFFFVNHGKIPAIIKEISVSLDHFTWMEEPTYFSRIAVPNEIVIPGGGFRLGQDGVEGPRGTTVYGFADPIPLNFTAAKSVRDGASCVWFYGRIVYDDVFGEQHVTPWWRRYNVTMGIFGHQGEPKWNRRT